MSKNVRNYSFFLIPPNQAEKNGHSVADVTAIIDVILRGVTEYDEETDVNHDSEVNISDVTALIDLLLGH